MSTIFRTVSRPSREQPRPAWQGEHDGRRDQAVDGNPQEVGRGEARDLVRTDEGELHEHHGHDRGDGRGDSTHGFGQRHLAHPCPRPGPDRADVTSNERGSPVRSTWRSLQPRHGTLASTARR
jgi:hypothetical protein